MQVKRFLAADMRRALEMVRQELGADAVILSSNRTPEGVELLTTRADEVATGTTPAAEPTAAEAPTESPLPSTDSTVPGSGQARAQAIERAWERQRAQRELEASAEEYLQPNQRVNAGIRVKRSLLDETGSGSRPRPVSAAERYGLDEAPGRSSLRAEAADETSTPEEDPRLASLEAELSEMRCLLEEQLSQILGRDEGPRSPTLASVGRRLERMGLPRDQARSLLEHTPARGSLAQAWNASLAQLSRQLPTDTEDPVASGGVFALVGPTGAGKTTTIGKLAARYVMTHGPREVALVTLDTYRLGGHDTLRSLARILGVTLRVVDDPEQLDAVLYSLRRHALVLIDTAGFRQGDPRLSEQMDTLARQPQVQPLMVLPASSQAGMLKASLHAYGREALTGCVLSKLDESTALGEALSVVMQGGVPIVYTTHGQDIPRDLEVVRPHQLVTRAARLIGRSEESGGRNRRPQAPDIRAV